MLKTPSTDMERRLYLLINGNYSGERLTYRSKKLIIVCIECLVRGLFHNSMIFFLQIPAKC